jgi:succinate dehydrogenase / fumarate reductase cytochrome b subunit
MSVNLVANNYYFVRRLHSLLGIVPLTLFMIEHFLVNSLSTVSSGAFNAVSGVLTKIPYLVAVELGLIIIPLYIHGVLGLWIVTLGSVEPRVPYVRNWLYLLQRATGIIVILFVTYHILATRVWHELYETHDLYSLMHDYLTNPFLFAIYIVGVAATSFHLGNGLFSFVYKWGVTVNERSQTWAMVLGLLIGLGFFAVGLFALIGFLQ